MTYELWDFVSGNAVGEFDTEGEALAAVQENVRAHGPTVLAGIALLSVEDDGESRMVAQGDELFRLLIERSAAG